MGQVAEKSYWRQLDGLRALSVAAVAWSHWRRHWFGESIIPYGELGVDAFFVISGFLITGILLNHRSEDRKWFLLKQFYTRRFLRIFPLFYATLLVAFVWQAAGMGESWRWHITYLSNVYFYLHGWHGQLSHFWSLAVEEQFYLFWPLLMVFLPGRFLLPAILTGIGLAPVFEIAMDSFYPSHAAGLSASVLMPSCLGGLGIGALLAYGALQKHPMQRLSIKLLALGMAGGLVCVFFHLPNCLHRLAEDCLLGWLVCSAAIGFRGPFGWLLESAPLNYLGKISYGLYVIHNFAAPLCESLISWLGHPGWLLKLYEVPVFRIFCFSGLTIGLASYSWHRFEKPLNDLKRKFPYPAKRSPTPVNLHPNELPG